MALTPAQAYQQALNTASALSDALVNGKPISDNIIHQQICQSLMLIAEAGLAGGATTSTLETGIANLANVSASAVVAHKQR